MVRFFAGPNQALGTELNVWFHEWWDSLFAEDESEESPEGGGVSVYVPDDYSEKTKALLEEQGYTEKDVELLEAAGLTETQVRRIWAEETDTQEHHVWTEGDKTPISYGYSATAYDAVYYVNDILAENTQVLTVSSRYYGDESYIYGNERLYAENTQSGQSTYLYDGRGSVVQVLEKLAVVNSMRYTDYGAPTVENPSAYTSWFGYNGEEHDPLTGLQYLRARYYSPQTGSFTAADSFAGILNNALSQNGYTYAHNNPVNFAASSGNSIWSSIKNGISNAFNTVKNTVILNGWAIAFRLV